MWKFLVKLFCAIFGCKEDIEIKICLNNPEPTKARKDCLETEVRKYPKGTVLPSCELDHNEYVYRDVCLILPEKEMIVYDYCPESTIQRQKRYIKGTEPKDWCKVHKKPDPPFVYLPKISDLHFDGLNMNLWFTDIAYDDSKRAETERQLGETLHEARIRRYCINSNFSWLSDGKAEHEHLNWKTPYIVENKKFHLNEWNPKWWELEEAYLEAHKLGSDKPEDWIDPCLHLQMDRYCDLPFRDNYNDVHGGLWSLEALPFHVDYARKICELYKKVFGQDYNPNIKIINEPIHRGNIDKWHTIQDYHYQIWIQALRGFTILENVTFDISHCEGAYDKCRDRHLCGKCKLAGIEHWVGDDKYNRKGLMEYHGVSVKEDVELLFSSTPNFLGSKNHRAKFSEDGGARKGNPASGFTIGGFRFADANEYEETCRYIWNLVKASSRPRRAIMGPFAVETFIYPWKTIFTKDNVNWDKMGRPAKVWNEIYGL